MLPHRGFSEGKLSETFLSENFASNGCSLGHMRRSVAVQGGQLSLAQSPTGEYVRKILESTDHTLVPTHYKQLAGQELPITFPQFQKEEACRADLPIMCV